MRVIPFPGLAPVGLGAVGARLHSIMTKEGRLIGTHGEDDLELLPLIVGQAGDLHLEHSVVPTAQLIWLRADTKGCARD